METHEEKRRHARAPYHSPLHFTVLSCDSLDFQRTQSTGEIIDASATGIGLRTSFPLQPGHVLEWDDKHQRGKLHIALVQWSQEEGACYRAGLKFI